MRANTFVGQVIAVLSRRASAFALDSTEPQTFPGRLRALLIRRMRTDSPPCTLADDQAAIEKSQAEIPKTGLFTSRHDPPLWQQSPEARETRAFDALRIRAHELKCQSPHDRLRLRGNPAFPTIERFLNHNRRDLEIDQLLDRDHGHSHDRAPILDLTLDRARDLTRDLTNALDRALELALDLDLDLDLDRVLALDRELDHTLNRTLDLARTLDRDLTRARTLALARAFARDLVSDLVSDLDLAFAFDLDRVLALALVRVRVFVLVRMLDPARDLRAGLDDLKGALSNFDDALYDFTTADLRNVDLTGVQLEGLRWSSATQWPKDWTAQVELDSVEVAPGVFEVRKEGRTYAPTLF